MTKKSRTNRIRTLYAIFIGIICLFIGMFIFNIVGTADPLEVAGMGDRGHDYGLVITDLQRPSALGGDIEVEGLDDSLSASVTVRTYDANFSSDSEHLLNSDKAIWCIGLQLLSVLSFVAMVVLMVMCVISFYINVRRGTVFPKKRIRWLTWSGVLMIVMSLSMDVSIWIEQSLAASLLAGSEWEPSTAIQLHTTRLLFGLTLIFLAQIFYIGREMQEDQELTI